jgi:hypothetical protein
MLEVLRTSHKRFPHQLRYFCLKDPKTARQRDLLLSFVVGASLFCFRTAHRKRTGRRPAKTIGDAVDVDYAPIPRFLAVKRSRPFFSGRRVVLRGRFLPLPDFLSKRNKDKTKTIAAESGVDAETVPTRRSVELDGRRPAAAAHDAIPAAIRIKGVRYGVNRIGSEPILAPFHNVAVHIKKSPGIGCITANRGRSRQKLAVDVRSARMVHMVAAKRIAPGISRRRADAASVFPLRFGRKRATRARWSKPKVVELIDELLAIDPRDLFHRQVGALEAAGIIPHNRLPHRLSYLGLKHPEPMRQRYLVLSRLFDNRFSQYFEILFRRTGAARRYHIRFTKTIFLFLFRLRSAHFKRTGRGPAETVRNAVDLYHAQFARLLTGKRRRPFFRRSRGVLPFGKRSRAERRKKR